MTWIIRFLSAVFGLAVLLSGATASAQTPDVTLTGSLTRTAHETYVELPFRVPSGVERLTVEFSYTGKAQRTVIDLGLRDPERFRGWSGGNKTRFTLAESDATPSYMPGPVKPGTWRLVLGVPNIRKDARADYVAKIWFARKGEVFAGFVQNAEPTERWYRGDLHMHTGHSDGTCLSQRGVRVACPVFKTLEAAAARGLDFIAITDHNTTSQFQSMRELTPYFDDLLLIPGREITTFQGHANLWGPTAATDFQLAGPRARSLDVILSQAHAMGGVVSINHPGLPSGEICMGCGWSVRDVDYSKIQAIEVVNGGIAEGPLSGVSFWEDRLNEGRRITAVGGSDNHDPTLAPDKAPAVGVPTTVVRAEGLSQSAILAAMVRGRVFIDLVGTRDRLLETAATQGENRAQMGDTLTAPAGTTVIIEVHAVAMAGASIELVGPASMSLPPQRMAVADTIARFEISASGRPAWVRAQVRDANSRLILLGNPIYLNNGP